MSEIASTIENIKDLKNSSVIKSSDCSVLRNGAIRIEDACYDPVYWLYISLVLIALTLTLSLFYLIFLCLSIGYDKEKEIKVKPS